MHDVVLLAYIPVLHQGYFQYVTSHGTKHRLLLVPPDLAQQYTPVHKELRALAIEQIMTAIESWNVCSSVEVADIELLGQLNATKTPVCIPDETVTRELAATYLPDCPLERSSIFLRWDAAKAATVHPITPDTTITSDVLAQQYMTLAQHEGALSSDWWRQVGAVAVRENTIIAQTHNTHLPSEQQPYAEGDARAHFHKGEHIELTTAIHAEAKLIAEAAAAGVSLKGTTLFVTDFPCPPCAKLIAHAGIRSVYFKKGYAMLDGERVLKQAGVEIVQVQ